MALSLQQFLILFLWFPLATLLGFLLLIARFYEKFSGERTFFRLFLLPMMLFGASAVRYASIDSIVGDIVADFAFGVGGLILIVLSLRLYWLMIVRRQAS